MFPVRHFASTVTALSLIAGGFFLSLFPAGSARAQGPACDEFGLAVLPSPVAPWKGAPLRVFFTVEKEVQGELSLIAPDGRVAATSRERHGGPPYFWYAEVNSPAAGKWQVRLARQGAAAGCETVTRDVAVAEEQPPKPGAAYDIAWPLRNAWTRSTENLYSAWIEKLFDAPQDQELSWKALHEVLRDKSRNALFNHLGLGEDEMGLVIKPDCADLPYFLRAYFAFKMGLPFGYSNCSRGGGGQPPKCYQWFSISKLAAGNASAGSEASAPAGAKRGLAMSFAQYLRSTGDAVHSASARTLAADDSTDYYPVPLTQDSLRPGVTYVDPFGHVLVISKRIAQTKDRAGVFLAVDAQPDGTVARKRFWRGNFLYVQDTSLGSPGFKRFRPVVRAPEGGLRRLSNAEIAKNPQYGDFTLEPSKLDVEAFYDKMDDVMSPAPLDPVRAMTEAITSLEEQVKTRVTSVENGRKFQLSGKGEASMPDGAAIFETSGAWEDFATPSRDLRLLIAIDVVRGFPDRVARRPERYAMPAGKSVEAVKAELQSVLNSELASRKFSYPRSDGSPWTLAVKDVVDRVSSLEMAYNVNDCVELRWGATEKSEEAATCKRYAPAAQRAKMTKYRPWFHERRRPARASG
jgi:hypothetical protein